MNIFAIILNIAVILLEIYGLRTNIPERGLKSFAFYTQLSNIAAFISGVLLLIFGSRPFIVALRLMACCMLLMTFLVVVFVLIPISGDPRRLLFTGMGLIFHLLCPVLTAISYLAFEKHSRLWILPVLVTFAYGMILLWLNKKGVIDGPYPFLKVRAQSRAKTVMWMTGLMIFIIIVSFAVTRIR